MTTPGKTAMAIPWRTDTPVIYYRRDLLRQAGVDEATAFATPHDRRHTLHCLQAWPDIMPCTIIGLFIIFSSSILLREPDFSGY